MANSQPESNVFSVRIVSIDHLMAPPVHGFDVCYSSFQGEKVNEVPVIRIYGPTPAGQKTCLHVHGVLPYLYVPCVELCPKGSTTHEEADRCAHELAVALEKALKLKGNVCSKRQHVHDCRVVCGKRFYGYHKLEELFVKIYLYYPHDVPRAATLLLNGGVLDKSLQPHESHIPYILQFLIDCNLYGMGHIHLSRLKFRHPVPEAVSPRRIIHAQSREGMNDSTPEATHFQADPGEVAYSSPVSTSSSVPVDWTWHASNELGTSSNEDISLLKRQSICELECDAVVDDILNQEFKTYASLSQSCSDVKLVQSLVPIWQEEYERTGMLEGTFLCNPEKPTPEDVLRTLSLGIGFESKLMELCGDVYQSSCKRDIGAGHSMLPSAVMQSLPEIASDSPNYVCPEPMRDLHEKDTVGFGTLNCSPHKKETGATSSKERDACSDLLFAGNVVASDLKATDFEALELLRWLATSQAAEDINSDDELIRETILTPILPAPAIDKVLEKASMDYESESQKECQDILDSVEDLVDFRCPEERASNVSEDTHLLVSKMVPQRDGSSDDPSSSFRAESGTDSLQKDAKQAECKKFLQYSEPQGCNTCSSSNSKPNKRLWGTLPISAAKTVSNESYACLDEVKDSAGAGSFVQNRLDKRPDDFISRETSGLTGRSVRDLMRRKRSRTEPAGCGSFKTKRLKFNEEREKYISLCRKKLEFHESHEDKYESKPPEYTCDRPLFMNQHAEVHEAVSLKTAHSEGRLDNVPISNNSYNSLEMYAHPCTAQVWGKSKLISKTKIQDFAAPMVHSELNDGKESESGLCPVETMYSRTQTSKSDLPCSVKKFGLKDKSSIDDHLQKECASSGCVSDFSAMHEMPGMEGDVRRHKKCKMCISSEKFPPAIDDTTLQDNRSCVGEQGRCSNSLERCSMSLVFDKEARPVKLIDRTLCREACEASENALDFTHLPSVDDESQEKSGRLSSGSLPCYDGGCPGETKCESKCLENSFHFSFEEAMAAVPRLYQNDGSYLHLLTPVISPPSADSVRRWLVAEKEGGARGISAVSLEPQSLKVASGCVVSAESSSSDDCGEAMLAESGSHTRDIFEQAAHEKDLVLDTKVNHDVNDLTSTPQSRGSTGDINTLVGDSQDRSQISGPDVKSKPTPLSQIGFRDSASIGAGQQLTLLSIEVQAECRGDLRPDPRFDAVNIISLAFQNDNDSAIKVHVLLYSKIESSQRNADGISGCKVFVFPEEKDLFGYFTKILCSLDPDIVMGWDVQAGSLGYLAERSAHLGIRLLNNISRILPEAKIVFESKVPQNESEGKIVDPLIAESAALGGAIIEDEWGRTHASGVHVGGRIVLNVWRLMRSEVKLNLYTVEAVAESVLMRKVPWIHHKVLRLWFSTGPSVARYRCIEYMVERAKLNLEMMNKLDMINRTSELARVFGIDFFSVLSRGSQYRVESMLLRLAHTQNYLAISPGNQQVASQPAMECIPLVMEPESGFYADPVVVLDFQSLYPSMIIAYNLCFCTCLGKVVSSKPNIMGVSSYSLDADVMKDLKDQILLAPNGAMYVPPKVRKGVLPRLLEEILSTRVLVKHAMKKLNPSQKILHRIFNARQLALKLIANVTYGYTAAGFSGRMPFAELADSIVECGRRTLEKAIAYVNANEKWRAKVVYGDTDSMFVMLKGRSSKEAFEIGNEIASAITAMNPNPVTLKMEKVYQPCFLLTKKRYVGYSYESPDQVKPLFDAKGIETVRRDTCRAVSKTVEQSLRLFFEHQDISEVKTYLQRQWTRIMSGRVSLQDFVFAKEVRLGTYSTSSSILPPAAIVAMKAMRVDPRAEPRYAERVPYVVIHGEPGARLIDMVVDPLQLLALDSPYRLNDLYYINKQIIPAVQRVFGLVGADLKLWFLEMPRPVRKAYDKHGFNTPSPHKRRIDYYYLSKHCILCGELVQASAHLCAKCCHNEVGSTAAIIGRTAKLERDMQHLAAICRHCGGGDWLMESGVKCTSLACSVFYERRKVQKELRGLSAIAHEKGLYPKCVIEWF